MFPLVPALSPQSPTWTASIGHYQLVKWVNPSGDRHTLYLKDPKGRVVVRLTDFHVGLLNDLWSEKPVKTKDVDKDGVPEVVFQTWSGGAHGSCTYQIWSLGTKPRCLLAYDKNNISDEHDFDLVDLDGDGTLEVRSWYDGFAYTVGASYWKHIPVVLRLEQGRYVDRTRRFRTLLQREQHLVWQELLKADLHADPASWGSTSGYAINVIALADLLGQRPAAWRRLSRTLPKRNVDWLKRREPQILAIIRGRTRRYEYPAPYAPGKSRRTFFPTDKLRSAFNEHP